MDDLPIVALRIGSSNCASHWRKLLAGVKCQLLADDELESGATPFDIVVTDGREQLEAPAVQQASPGIYAVIGIGAGFAADVVFADDPTEHELQLACDLLYEIVQLRRERAASHAKQQMLTQMAELDGLTGLANRRAWDAELARRMICGNDTDSPLCLALFDLDHFKEVNTAHGYPVADKVLQQVGRALKASVRADDFVARIGGDEFGVLLSNISAERAEAAVERIRAGIEPALEQSGLVIVTATAGLASRQPSQDAATLFSVADTNLRRGKSAGRNRTVASTERDCF